MTHVTVFSIVSCIAAAAVSHVMSHIYLFIFAKADFSSGPCKRKQGIWDDSEQVSVEVQEL